MNRITKKIALTFVLIATIGGNASADSSTSRPSSLSAEVLLDKIKLEIISQSVDSGLSISSSGFIDSNGTLTESTYYETGTQVSGIAMPRLLQQGREIDSGIDTFVRSISRGAHVCANSRPRYRKEVGIVVENIGWDSNITSGISKDLAQALRSSLNESLGQSVSWYTTRAPQDTRSIASTSYFSALNNANRDAKNARFLIKVNIEFDRGRSGLTQGVRKLGSASAKVLTAASRSQLFAAAVRPKRSESFNIHVSLNLAESLTGVELIRHQLTLSVPATPHNLLSRRLSSRNLNKLGRELAHFNSLLEEVGQCIFDETPLLAQGNHISSEAKFVTLNKGSTAGVRAGDRFILSAKPFARDGSVPSPGVLDSIAIGEVTNVNLHNASLEIIAGQTEKPYVAAVPF